MSTISVQPPFLVFADREGDPLELGSIYIGTSGQNPLILANQIAVYSNSALTTPVAQPIRTSGGYPMASGSPIRLYIAASAYSITILDSNDGLVFSAPSTSLSLIDLTTDVTGTLLSTLIKYDRTAMEIAAGVTPVIFYRDELDPRRYANNADWTLVVNQVNTLLESYAVWYRGDRAVHPTLTNSISGFGAYNDYATGALGGTIGYRCTVNGVQACAGNAASTLAGGSLCAYGFQSQQMGVDTSGNCSFGSETLRVATGVASAHNNTFGHQGINQLVAGTQNNGFAYRVIFSLLRGNNNHFFGESGLFSCLYGSGNHGFGFQNQYSKLAGNYSHSSGSQALFSETQSTIVSITKAASAVVTISTGGAFNPFSVGQPVSFVCPGPGANMVEIHEAIALVSAIGGATGAWTVTVNINSTAYSTFTSGYLCPFGNQADGYKVGFQLTLSGGNTLRGAGAVSTGNPGYGNTVDGFEAGLTLNATSSTNAALNNLRGFWAGRALTTASSCVADGNRALINGTTCDETVAIGPNSANGTTTALRGVHVGSSTGVNLNGNNTTNVGYNAGSTAAPQTYSNTGNFGANAVPNASDRITFGDASITQLRAQVTVITALSDIHYKKKVKTLEIPDGFLDELRIVTFEWDNTKPVLGPDGNIGIDEDGLDFPPGIQVGVIAQELDKLQTKYGCEWLGLVDKTNPYRWEATPFKIFFPLVTKIQAQEKRMRSLEADVLALVAAMKPAALRKVKTKVRPVKKKAKRAAKRKPL